MSDVYHIHGIIAKIYKDPQRDNPKQIQRYLCTLILHKWDMFINVYKNFDIGKECRDIESFLALIFDIKYNAMCSIIQQLELYKNYKDTEKDALQSCCNVKLSFKTK